MSKQADVPRYTPVIVNHKQGVVTVTFGPDTWRSQNTVLLLTPKEARLLLGELECVIADLDGHCCDDNCLFNKEVE